jgi:hypothetical protein
VNDTEATGKQVAEELKNMAEGITPLAVVTVAVVIAVALLTANDKITDSP